ncbi:rhomboid family intramembrane serine protease [Haloarcula sp. JP-L23]|uniref:rhomboid family intramembrane serine protease n=1 Tax=Haloarcula sp. JP-L23 TaxID=2716717 RepID=UPI00140F2820|nr:rhomboid family intramembrane serine protease [Haloarcula sp. JP-L23]
MRRPAESPTLVTLLAIVAVFALQQVVGLVARQRHLFALSNPLLDQPWTLVTSVYAHAGPSHLLANAAALALAGLLLERTTTSARFHGFFVTVGALSGVAQVAFVGTLGPLLPGIPASVSVLGASGAIFGLFGYLLAANRFTETVVGGFELAPRAQLALGGVLAAAITLLTANPGVALVAHFTGLLLGFLAGRAHLLRPADTAPEADPARF